MKQKSLYLNILIVILWLTNKIWGPLWSPDVTTGSFRQVRIGGNLIEGDIKMVKLEFGQSVIVTAGNFKDRKGNDATVQKGTAEWSVIAANAEGDPFEELSVVVDPANELSATVFHSGTTELTGVVTFRADGDTDENEEAPIVLTLSVIVDSLNAATGELSAGTPSDV